MILITNNDVSCNHIIIQSFHHHEDASLAVWALFTYGSTTYQERSVLSVWLSVSPYLALSPSPPSWFWARPSQL